MGLGNGLVGLFKRWGKGIGNAADHVWLREDAQKAIRDEITNKFKPKIDIANGAASRRAENIKDLGERIKKSKQDLADAQQAWQDKYKSELAAAQNQRQTEIANYNAQSKAYQDALDKANAGRDSIIDQLRYNQANYDPSRTIFTDVTTGRKYIFNPLRGEYKDVRRLPSNEQRKILKHYSDYENRLLDKKSGNVINAFDESDIQKYRGNQTFNEYVNKIKAQDIDFRNAENEINRANSDLTNWTANNSQPKTWGKRDLNQFEQDFEKNNAKPTGYSFNGKNYSDEPALDAAYQKALNHAQYKRDRFKTQASDYASERDAEIAKRIQDAKDMNKAKAFLVGAGGAGALYAGAKAMYGSDDTDNTGNIDNINNTDNTDNTDYGKPDPEFKAENTPEGKAALNGKSIDAGFDPDKADAVATLAAAAHDEGVEDSNSIESSDDRIMDDDELYGLLKAMEDPHKADAVANYIYSKHGDKPDVQRLGWRGWLNKYYGDLLRSKMNLDPSSYNGMHISGGL